MYILFFLIHFLSSTVQFLNPHSSSHKQWPLATTLPLYCMHPWLLLQKPKPSRIYQPQALTRLSPSPTSSTQACKPQKPCPNWFLSSSPYCPQVMAADRLFSWHTPYGLSHDKAILAELPLALAESAKMSIAGTLATSSKSTYGAGLLCFNQFCDWWQISEVACMPASYALLCTFIGNHKGSSSGKTIKSWLSGIHAWHISNHVPWYGDNKWVQMAQISTNKEGYHHKRPLHAPVSIEHLLALQRPLTPFMRLYGQLLWLPFLAVIT